MIEVRMNNCVCVVYRKYRRSGNFHVKNNSRENFRVVKFSRSRSIHEIFLTVDDCNMDERLESSWRLVYYQVSGEPEIAAVVVDWTFNSGVWTCARKHIH